MVVHAAELLFVYGTLHPNRAPEEIAHAVSRFIEVGPATIPGILHDLGPYPGVTPPTHPRQTVQGTLFALPAELLADLDAYEGFDPATPETSLFRRVRLTATRPDGSDAPCFAYLYNRSFPLNKPTEPNGTPTE